MNQFAEEVLARYPQVSELWQECARFAAVHACQRRARNFQCDADGFWQRAETLGGGAP